MDRKKLAAAAGSAAAAAAILAAGGISPADAFCLTWGAARHTAFLAAGVRLPDNTAPFTEYIPQISTTSGIPDISGYPDTAAECSAEAPECTEAAGSSDTPEPEPEQFAASVETPSAPQTVPAGTEDAENQGSAARVVTQNIFEFDDGVDRVSAGKNSGIIYRRHYGGYVGDDYITLPGGGMVWNCTADSAETLLGEAEKLPDITLAADSDEPQVLIVHTHTTESYEPYQRNYYDADYPFRTRDPDYNMTRVGDALAQRLAEHGISVLHDGTIHDYPAYTGAYDRSEVTIRAALEKYPSIKIIIDLHRDAIASADGSRTAPVAEINGRNAAQFMIITGCDDGRFGSMPDYLENFRLACLIQQSSEKLYPGLARPVLFDYRNYNQHISTGSLLIEVGSHANSLDEAVYSGELLGDCMADALLQLAD